MVSLAFVASRFAYFNQLCFEGKLPEPSFRLSRARKALGQIACKRQRTLLGRWHYSQFVFVISSVGTTNLSDEELDDIILHEMIHYYILSNQMQDSSAHGQLFRCEMQRINSQFARNITITRREKPGENAALDAKYERQSFVVVIHLQDGNLGVMAVAKTRLFQMWDFLAKAPAVCSAEWYVTRNSFFGRMPRRTSARYYIMKPEILKKELRDAVRLERIAKTIRSVVAK